MGVCEQGCGTGSEVGELEKGGFSKKYLEWTDSDTRVLRRPGLLRQQHGKRHIHLVLAGQGKRDPDMGGLEKVHLLLPVWPCGRGKCGGGGICACGKG